MALKEIMGRLSDIQFDIITSRLDKSLPKKEIYQNTEVYRVGNPMFLKKILLPKNLYPLSAFIKAFKLSKKNKYDVIFALQASQGAGAAWLFKFFKPNTPFILNIQEGKNLDKQGFLINFFRRLIIRKADIITVISTYLKEYVLKINSKAKVFVIPNGVDLNKFKNQNSKIKIDDKNSKVIVTVSRLVEKNGVTDLIDAFNVLVFKFKVENLKLLIIGDGLLRDSLKFKILNLKLENKVTMLGSVSNDDLPRYLAQADVFARPSLSEGLGTAFLEAMATGVPVIGTAKGGIPDFLKDRETGLICNANDPNDLAEKIKLILDDPALRKTITHNAQKLIAEKYSWDKITKQYNDIFIYLNI